MSSTRLRNARAWKQASTHILLASLLLLLTFSSCRPSPPSPTDPPPFAVRTSPVRTGPIRQRVEYVGTVHSTREIRVLSRVSGTLLDLPIKEGHDVRKGNVIARMSAPEAHARVQQVAAEASRAHTERVYLCNRFDTDQQLADAGALHPAQLDLSRKGCEASQAAERAAKAAHAEVHSVAAKSTESAPFDGRVLQWLAEPGEHLLPGKPLLLLGNQPLEVRIPVAELDVERGLRPGTPVELHKSGEKVVQAAIASVAPMATGPGRTIEVRVPIPEGERDRFSHGQSMNVSFVVSESEAATSVPVDAIRREGENNVIFLIENDVAKRKTVTLGPRDGAWIAVLPAPGESARVAVTGLDQLRDGMKVYSVMAEGVGR